jgi:hypothetical protein
MSANLATAAVVEVVLVPRTMVAGAEERSDGITE